MAAARGPTPSRIPAAAAVAVSAVGAFLAVTLFLFLGLGVYYAVAGHYYDREHEWLSPDGILRNFKIAFYGMLAVWTLAVPGLAYGTVRWLRGPQTATVLLAILLLILAVGPMLLQLSFSNACTLGESFPFPDMSC
jgi:hypothetical protein